MRIDFRTKTGKRLGTVTLLQFSTSWAALVTALMFVYAPTTTVSAWLDWLLTPLDFRPPSQAPHIGLLGLLVNPWIFATKALAAVVAFWLAWIRGVRGALLWVGWELHERVLLRTRLITNKVFDVIKTYPNTSREAYDSELKDAKQDITILQQACRDKIITNETTLPIDWVDRNRQYSLGNIPNNDDDRVNELNRSYQALIEASNNISGKKVSFYVAAVQPSVIYVLGKIVKKCGIGHLVQIHSSSSTGPQTIWAALNAASARAAASAEDELIMFAAPLSAYVMFDPQSPETPDHVGELSSTFEAVCVLLHEKQDILVVDDGNRVTVRKGRILYYNNSTAEECWAKSAITTRPIFDQRIINRYSDYISYLIGRAPQNEQPLRPGDAILTWPPLTRYFEGKSVGTGYFNRTNVFERNLSSTSRILLFSERRNPGCQTTLHDFSDILVDCFMGTMLDLRIKYDKTVVPTHVFDHWRFLSPYSDMFRRLLRPA